MSEQLEKNSGTFLPIAICLIFVAIFVVGAVQSSIPSTANATPVESVIEADASDAEPLVAPVSVDSDETLEVEEDTFEENGETDVETVAYVEGAAANVEGSEPFYSQC